MNSQSKQPGCFSYGCLISAFIVIILGAFLTWWGIRSVKGAVEMYTTPAASSLVRLSEDVSSNDNVNGDKLLGLLRALDSGNDFADSFTSTDLNAAVRIRGLEENISLALNGDKVFLRFSLPLGFLGEWRAARIIVPNINSRFATGELAGKFEITDGVPKVELEKFVLNQKLFDEMARGHASTWLEGALVSALGDLSLVEKLFTQDSLLHVTVNSAQNQAAKVR